MTSIDGTERRPMPVMHIPSHWRELTGGNATVEVKGATVQAILRDLVRQYPVMQPYLFHEDETIRDEVGIAVNAVMTDNNPLDPVPEGAEIHLVPAIAGGGR